MIRSLVAIFLVCVISVAQAGEQDSQQKVDVKDVLTLENNCLIDAVYSAPAVMAINPLLVERQAAAQCISAESGVLAWLAKRYGVIIDEAMVEARRTSEAKGVYYKVLGCQRANLDAAGCKAKFN